MESNQKHSQGTNAWLISRNSQTRWSGQRPQQCNQGVKWDLGVHVSQRFPQHPEDGHLVQGTPKRNFFFIPNSGLRKNSALVIAISVHPILIVSFLIYEYIPSFYFYVISTT